MTSFAIREVEFCAFRQAGRLVVRPPLFPLLLPKGGALDLGLGGDAVEPPKPWQSDDPPGVVLTNMVAVGRHGPELFYASEIGYFRARYYLICY